MSWNAVRNRLIKLFRGVMLVLNDKHWNPLDWTIECQEPARQLNGYDCGVFTIFWAIMELLGLSLSELEPRKCVKTLRYKIMYACLKKIQSGVNDYAYDMKAAGFTTHDKP